MNSRWKNADDVTQLHTKHGGLSEPAQTCVLDSIVSFWKHEIFRKRSSTLVTVTLAQLVEVP